MVSVPSVPRNTRWLSFSVITSSTEWSGTLAFPLELVNCRLPPSSVRVPPALGLTPSKPMNCVTLVPVTGFGLAGSCATAPKAVNPTMLSRAIAAARMERRTIAVSFSGSRDQSCTWIAPRPGNAAYIRGATIDCSAQKVNACVPGKLASPTSRPRSPEGERSTVILTVHAGSVAGPHRSAQESRHWEKEESRCRVA